MISPLGLRTIKVGPGSLEGGLGTGIAGPGYVSGNYDESVGWSIAVHQASDGHSSTVSIAPGALENYILDCSGLDGQRVYVILEVNYGVGASTSASVRLVNGAEIDAHPNCVILGHVDVPANISAPIDASMIGYDDPSYPRLTPLSTPSRSGLMPASAWAQFSENLPWQNLVYADRDPFNNFVVRITPSQKTFNNRRYFTYIQANVSSRFPRSATGNYNGGENDDQLTSINLSTGVISGAHQVLGNLSIPTPPLVGTPNAFQNAIIAIDPKDQIFVYYSDVYSSKEEALADSNFVAVGKKLYQICLLLFQTDSGGVLKPLGASDVLDRRPFVHIGAVEDTGADVLERYKDQFEESIYRFMTPCVFPAVEEAFVDPSSTGTFSVVTATFDLDASENLTTKQMLGDEFLQEGHDINQIDLTLTYVEDSLDTAPSCTVSRDGGLNFQPITLKRVGATDTFNSTYSFNPVLETVNQSLFSSASSPSTSLAVGANQKIAQAFSLTDTNAVTNLQLQVNKAGTPAGSISVKIVRNSSGLPSASSSDVVAISSPISIGSIVSGNSTLNISIPRSVLTAGTYHIVVEADTAYAASFVSGATEIRWRSGTGTGASLYSGSWSSQPIAMSVQLSGSKLSLTFRVTASESSKILGIAAFYDVDGAFTFQTLEREVVTVTALSNPSSFLLQSFVPDPQKLMVFEVASGKVYVAPMFTVSGQSVSFPAGMFNSAQPITLVFRNV